MAEHVAKESYEIAAWKGTPQDVVDLLDRARQLASEADPQAEDRRLSITVETGAGATTFDDLSEFRDYANATRLAEAEDLFALVESAHKSVDASIKLQRNPWAFAGARISVSGTNHVAVSGLLTQLSKELEKGKRRRPRFRWVYLGGLLAVVGVSIAGSFANDVSQRLGWAVTGIALVLAVLTGSVPFALPALVPSIEILDPDDPRSRYERWRGKVLAAAGALLLVVIGVVLQAALAN